MQQNTEPKKSERDMQEEPYYWEIYIKNVNAHIFKDIRRERPLRPKYTQNWTNNRIFMKEEVPKRGPPGATPLEKEA